MNMHRSFPPITPRPARFDAQAYFDLAPVLQANFDKTELRDEVIYEMPADGALTTLWNSAISRWLHDGLGPDYLIVTDKSLRLSTGWVPTSDHYVTRDEAALERALPEMIDLVIEVSDTTLESDPGEKAAAYGAHGIREYWVIDPREKCLHVHRLGAGGTYGRPRRVGFAERADALLIAGLCLRLADLPRLS